MSDDDKRAEQRRVHSDRFKGSLMIRTPKVENDAERARWHGVPPTPLATAAKWRPKDITF